MLAIDVLQLEHFAPEERQVTGGKLHILVAQLQDPHALVVRGRGQGHLGALHQDHGAVGAEGAGRVREGAGPHRAVRRIMGVVHVQQAHRVVLQGRAEEQMRNV